MSKSLGNNPGLSRRAIEQEQEYWQRLGNVVDDKLCRVYGAVERNLQSYHQLLKERASSLREVSMPLFNLHLHPSCLACTCCCSIVRDEEDRSGGHGFVFFRLVLAMVLT